MDNARIKLEELIEKELDELKNLEEGSEKDDKINNVSKLYKLYIDEKIHEETDSEAYERRLLDEKKQEADVEAAKNTEKNHILEIAVNGIVAVGTTLIGIVAYNHWFHKGLKFEETGSITAQMNRGLLNKLTPKK